MFKIASLSSTDIITDFPFEFLTDTFFFSSFKEPSTLILAFSSTNLNNNIFLMFSIIDLYNVSSKKAELLILAKPILDRIKYNISL